MIVDTIAIILLLAALYCGVQWVRIFYWLLTGSYSAEHEETCNRRAFQLGLCFILALGFVGLMVRP